MSGLSSSGRHEMMHDLGGIRGLGGIVPRGNTGGISQGSLVMRNEVEFSD